MPTGEIDYTKSNINEVANPDDGTFGGAVNSVIDWLTGGPTRRSEQDAINDYNYRVALEKWNRENEYNSPQAQMQRLIDAGLNPHLAYGSVGNASAGIAQHQSPAAPQVSGIGSAREFGEMFSALNLAEKFIRVQREQASLEQQQVYNSYQGRLLDGRIGLSQDLRLTYQERNTAQRIANKYYEEYLVWRNQIMGWNNNTAHMNSISAGLRNADMMLGFYDAAAELVSYGLSESTVNDIFRSFVSTEFDENGRMKSLVDKGLKSWYDADRSADRASRDADISENVLSKILSDAGLSEGDPLYQRLMAVKGVGSTGQTAAAITEKIIQFALGAQGAVGNSVRNAYMRKMSKRASFLPYGKGYVDIETGEYY